ncbi:MAG: Mth938-like domain-containing protein [Sulfuricella sp.]|nr:Mth938-like domain-containing protein [Sulfuricella sp.]
MQFNLADAAGLNLFTAYGEDYVAVNHQTYRASLIVLPEKIVADWPPSGFEALSQAHFEAILEFQPEIVLLGTGPTLRFPHPSLTQALIQAQIGLEVMDTAAACRTYNILVTEGRRVAAALIIGCPP